MTHGDDSGLILPPRVAPYQVVIVPIPRGNWQETVLPKAREIQADLVRHGVRVMLDDRDAYTPGWKFAEWEMRGVPLRLEIGPKDIEKAQVMLARRDTREKLPTPMDGLAPAVAGAARRDPGVALRARAASSARSTRTRVGIVRRVQGGDGRPARVRHRRLVRQRRLRGADQGRDAGDAAEHPVQCRRRPIGGDLREVRARVRVRRSLVRESVRVAFRLCERRLRTLASGFSRNRSRRSCGSA